MTTRKQTRRSISVSGDLYKELRAVCQLKGLPMSTYIEELARSSIGMDARDPDVAKTVFDLPSAPLRPKTKTKAKKKPPRETPTAVTPPHPVPVISAPVPENTEDLLDEGRRLGVSSGPLPPDEDPPDDEVDQQVVHAPIYNDVQDDPEPPRKPRTAPKRATPDVPPDSITEEILADREIEQSARDLLMEERRKSFESWARKHSTSAEELKPNGKRRNGNIHLL